MTSRERVTSVFLGEIPDRVPMADPFWKETILAWHKQGLPEGIHPAEYFNLDIRYAYFLDTSLQYKEELIEKGVDYEICRDAYGRTVKRKTDADATPRPLSWPISGEEDLKALESRLKPNAERISFGYYGDYFEEPSRPSGIEATLRRRKELIQDENTFVLVNMLECYETAMRLMGDEHLLMAMVESPQFITSIFDVVADLIIGTMEILLQNLPTPNGVFLAGDIAYKNGPLFSPAMYSELLQPAHRKIFDFFRSKGLFILYHTDGYFLPMSDGLIDAGIHAVQPLEVKAGLEAEHVKRELGDRIVLMGNLSVPELCAGEKRMRKELDSKLPILMKKGGYIYSSDHSIPPTMRFEDYCKLVEIVKIKGKY